MKPSAVFLIAVATFTSLVGCGKRAPSTPVLVFAAASLAVPLDSVIADFKHSTGIDVQVSYGASGTLAQQIRAGATAALFFSADTAWIERLAAEDTNLIAVWWTVLTNRLVVFTSTDSPHSMDSLHDLLSPGYQRIVIANPGSAPVGRYARTALESVGVYDSLNRRLLFADNATAVVATVRSGLAEAGIAYATDVANVPDIRVVYHIPGSLHPPIAYGLAVLRPAPPGASELAAAIRSHAGLVTFVSAGFAPVESPGATEVPPQ